MKLCFLDLETTGTDPKRHGVIQIAGAIVIDGIEKERFNYRLRPFQGDDVNKQALSVNGVTTEQLRGLPEPLIAYRELVGVLGKYVDKFARSDKFFFVGYNAGFDDDFLRAFFEKAGDKYYGSWFGWPAIDVAGLAALALGDERWKLPNFKLMTVAKRLGVVTSDEGAHEAGFDVEVTRRIYERLTVSVKGEARA
jgi:DNA polymerase-3 subunit epsilon